MKRKLFTQIANEWRSNLWLAVELMIVSVVMWFLTDYLYTTVSIINEPKGFDTGHCYLINYETLPENSPEYVAYKNVSEKNDDVIKLLESLRSRPEIESVALGMNSYFYNGSNSHHSISIDSLSKRGVLSRIVTPDFPRVFRLHGARGETPEKLAELLRDTEGFIISDNALKYNKKRPVKTMAEYIGRSFLVDDGDGGDTATLAGVIVPPRYDDFTQLDYSVSSLRTVPEKDYHYLNELVVRVRENLDRNFIDNLMNDAERHFRIGNLYIASVQSFDDIRQIHQRDDVSEMRGYFIGTAFLALNIFLGLLGTFWYRTQQRVPEIAIRKVSGANSASIFRRVIAEGELILMLVMPIAIAIDWLLVHFEFNTFYHRSYFEPVRFTACVLISWASMSLMILLGTAIPAWKAMKIMPAEALSAE